MDFSVLNPVALILAIMVASTPLLFAAIGELVVEKSGVLNLGVEGMMIFGAVIGFVAAVESGSAVFGVICGAIGGAVISMTFGLLTQLLLSNQVATGLGLTLFGLGLAALVGQPYSGIKPPTFPAISIGSSIRIDLLLPFSFVLVAAVSLFLAKSRWGLILRAVGENHDAAHALGYRVVVVRLCAIAFGGACAGLGGAYLSLIRVPQWTEGMTAGAGWIALAIVVFAAWKPWRCLIGAYLFGGVTIIQLNIQALGINAFAALGFLFAVVALSMLAFSTASRLLLGKSPGLSPLAMVLFAIAALFTAISAFTGWSLPAQYLSMTPYLVTIAVLVIMSADQARAALNAPGALGRVFQKTG